MFQGDEREREREKEKEREKEREREKGERLNLLRAAAPPHLSAISEFTQV